MPRTTTTVTISLDPVMAKQVERVRRSEHRTRSELWREAMRAYLRVRARPVYTPTASEQAAMAEGLREIRRGDYFTLDEFRAFLLGDEGRSARQKERRTRSTPRTRTSRSRT